ncbi:hypothetical protein TRFO_33351 [Tritrichomonas foetus]|uniref:Bacterial surface antigen (D15) domain-containing protein n=1 Tax=Tritrichomonas foetus TaxID=1144522 RepID=A0A1J4JRB5_9EUKA|nr:hypothetical protein TRFO_33351 [Tritrichomonas foetus]|eukprot:OHT00054.1 hypothetical protein TRFO_33351 [Tritrichomonas foetus]
MGNKFSFVSVRFQPETPEWFPREQLAEFISDSYKRKSSDVTDEEIFEYFSKKVKQVAYISPVSIERKRRFFNWFSTVLISMNTENHIIPLRIKGVIKPSPHIRPGIQIRTGFSMPPNTIRTTLQLFSPSKYDFSFSFQKPDFLATSHFLSEEHPVPFSNYQIIDTHTKLFGQPFHTISADYSYTWRNFTRIATASISHIINQSGKKSKNVNHSNFNGADSILYYDPISYNKLSFTMLRKFANNNQFGEAGLLNLPDSILPLPYLKLQIQNIFCFPNYAKAYLEGGCLLSPKAVPLKERLHVGGPPFARGIPSLHFSAKSCGIPAGCDFYVAGGFQTLIKLLPKLDFHFFVNGGLAALTKSTFFLDFTPSLSAFASYGCGYVYHFAECDCELNFNVPFATTSGLSFDRFQWALVVK